MKSIGVIIALSSYINLWSNGINQNALFLVDLLKMSKKWDVHILNLLDLSLNIDSYDIKYYLNEYLKMDVIINVSGFIGNNNTDKCNKLGIKTVMYSCGNDYLFDMESCIFKDGIGVLDKNTNECWYVPQNHECNEWYYKRFISKKSFPIPFIWSPNFLEKSIANLKIDKNYKNKNIAIMEPNINVQKYCMNSILISEKTYQKDDMKKHINNVYTFNSLGLKDKQKFSSAIKQLDLYKDNKITFEGRLPTPIVLYNHADIVLSHQMLNNLNYLYLDVAYLGYPIIHNANLCKNIGYYYDKFDVEQGSDILEDVIKNHDNNREDYIKRNRLELNKYLTSNPDIIKCYDNLIVGLFNDTNTTLKYNFETNLFDNYVDINQEIVDNIDSVNLYYLQSDVYNSPKVITNNIPKVIYTCHKIIDFNLITYSNNWIKLNPDYKIELYDDVRCKDFLLKEYSQLHLDIFEFIKDGPIKSDFWRLCVINKYGGIYVDSDIEPLMPLNEYIENDDDFVTCISEAFGKHGRTFNFNPHFIMSYKNNKVLDDTIQKYIQLYNNNIPYDYWSWSVCKLFDIRDVTEKKSHVMYIDNKKCKFLIESKTYDYCEYNDKKVMNNRYSHYKNHKFDNIKYKSNIPKILIQTRYKTCETREIYDSYIDTTLNKCFNGWCFFNFESNEKIINYFTENKVNEFPNIIKCFNQMSDFNKLDLFIYYFLYMNGGCYMNNNTMLHTNIENIIKDYSSVFIESNFFDKYKHVFNGFICVTPRNIIIKNILEIMCNIKYLDEIDSQLFDKELLNIIKLYDTTAKIYIEKLKISDGDDKSIIYNENGISILTHYFKNKLIPENHTLWVSEPVKQNIITFDTNDLKVSLYRNDFYITNSFIKGSYWDIDILNKLKKYINPLKNILEIGGHCGTSSLMYSKYLSNDNKIFVYEPQQNMFNLLNVNIKQNNLNYKIISYNNAIFCKEITIEMNDIDLDGNVGANIKEMYENTNNTCNFGGTCIGKGGESVKALVLDNIGHENIGFIHCDAQGSENFIFSSGKEFIKKHRPVIFYGNNSKYPESRYLYNNVCKYYPEYKDESVFDIEHYCIVTLGYSKVINRFNGVDDLLIP
jgi:FkbM family methyltransferase